MNIGRHPFRSAAVGFAALCAVACGSVILQPPNDGSYFTVRTSTTYISNSSVKTLFQSQAIDGTMLQALPPISGWMTWFGPAYSGSDGQYYVHDGVTPANWGFRYQSGPCLNKQAQSEVHYRDLVDFQCFVTISDPLVAGYLSDGTPVYTGGDDKLVFNFNETLNPNECRTSADGQIQLCYQSDGNLVLYAPGGPVWASNTYGQSAGRAVMQGDGNFVVYNASNVAVWASNTYGQQDAFVVVQNNRCALMYSQNGSYIPWGTSTCQ